MLSYLRRFDWLLMGGVFLLSGISLVTLSSLDTGLFYRQMLWYVLFLFIVLFGSRIDWRWLVGQRWFRHAFYWLGVFLVFIVNFGGDTIRGTSSWFSLGPFRFQPAEFVKVALIFLLAGYFSRKHMAAWVGRNIFFTFLYAAIPPGFVMMHPDFGSAMVLLGLWIGFLFMSGFHIRRVLFLFVVFSLLFAIGWMFVLQPYQKDRLSGFLFPEKDPLGVSYNVIQSKIAIGSAGFWGKGYGFGTQTHLRFLPEAETDFILAAFVEEWGVAGGLFLLLTFFFVVFRITGIGLRSVNNDYRFISLGAALVLMIHFFVNAGSNLGLTPVTGIPFPFISYGGSHLLTLGILISIIQRVNIES